MILGKYREIKDIYRYYIRAKKKTKQFLFFVTMHNLAEHSSRQAVVTDTTSGIHPQNSHAIKKPKAVVSLISVPQITQLKSHNHTVSHRGTAACLYVFPGLYLMWSSNEVVICLD